MQHMSKPEPQCERESRNWSRTWQCWWQQREMQRCVVPQLTHKSSCWFLYLTYTLHICSYTRPSSAAYRTQFCTQLMKAFVAETSCNYLLIDSAMYFLTINSPVNGYSANLFFDMCLYPDSNCSPFKNKIA